MTILFEEMPKLDVYKIQFLSEAFVCLVSADVAFYEHYYFILMTRFLLLIFYSTLSLHFTPGLQSAVSSLHFTLSLHFTPGLQSAVCVLH